MIATARGFHAARRTESGVQAGFAAFLSGQALAGALS